MDGSGRPRTAVLVIHGIGEQAPLATLGLFSQGLMDHLGLKEPRAALRECGGELLPVLLFEGAPGTGALEVLEFSWQHLARGRSGVLRTLGFCLETMLAPLDFRRHWRVLAAAGEGTGPSPWLLVLRQLLTAGMLLFPLFAAVVLLGFGSAELLAFLRGLHPERLPLAPHGAVTLALGLFVFLLALLQLLAAAGDAAQAARLRRRSRRLHASDWAGLHGGASRGWRVPALLSGAVLVATALALFSAGQADWAVLLDWLGQPANRRFLTGLPLLGAGLLLGGFFAAWLRDYAGDLAWYVDADRKPQALTSRHDIKSAAATLLTALLRDPDVDRIVIAGHSLGSVIGLDALNLLSRRQRAGAALPLAKLAGLVTFGSPLDKVAYFFREHTRDDAAVHAQLLSFLHPSGRLPSKRDDGPYRLKEYGVPLADLHWVNFHAPLDPISDPLVFYRVSDLVRVSYWPPGAHGQYWRDARVYRVVGEMLAGKRP